MHAFIHSSFIQQYACVLSTSEIQHKETYQCCPTTTESLPLLVALTSCEGLCVLLAHDQVITGLQGRGDRRGVLGWA